MSVSLEGINKSFGDLQALRNVDLKVDDGQVHALLGANGSGKSTLSKCLSGAYQPDSGRMRVGTLELDAFASPVAAAAAGVRIVHQDSPLINSMRVLENFALQRGYPARGGSALGRVHWRQLRKTTREAIERVGVDISPDVLAGELGPAERAMVSLALTLHDLDAGVELLILDEVTASIPEGDAMEFLERVRRLPDMGVPVLLVTHRFKEVAAYADHTTILSAGEVVHSGPSKELTTGELVEFMTAARSSGSAQALAIAAQHVEARISVEELEQLWARPTVDGPGDEPVLVAEGISGEFLKDVSFQVKPGEIVGIAGLPESGIYELPELLSGARPRRAGKIVVSGHELTRHCEPADVIRVGLASAPRDRRREGGAMSLSVAENMTLPVARRFWHKRREERSVVKRFMQAFDVRPPLPDVLFGTLSGGNQQKVVVAKWLITKPRVLVLDDPTAGVDPGARRQLFSILHEAAERGLALIIFSTEPEQFSAHCSRVIVLGDGRVVAELSGDELDAATINQKVTTLSSV
jgi:ribose transport system ATP-binding protein